MYLLTAIPPPTCRSTTVIVNATFCHCLSRYQTLPTAFPNASGSGRMRYTLDRFRDVLDAVRPEGLVPDAQLVFTWSWTLREMQILPGRPGPSAGPRR